MPLNFEMYDMSDATDEVKEAQLESEIATEEREPTSRRPYLKVVALLAVLLVAYVVYRRVSSSE